MARWRGEKLSRGLATLVLQPSPCLSCLSPGTPAPSLAVEHVCSVWGCAITQRPAGARVWGGSCLSTALWCCNYYELFLNGSKLLLGLLMTE